MQLTTLSDVEPERASWLWSGRIPLGKLVTLDGDPGLGKSTLALAIAAVVTTAGTWPDGSRCRYPGDVLLMSAEDGLADTVRPRLDVAGGDATRVHAVEGVPIIDESGERVLRPPNLADIAALDEAIAATSARLIVVDVVMAYLPSGTDSHKDQDIRRVLSALAAMADRTSCTVLLLRHLNKASGRDPLYRGGGSIGIVGAARSGLLVASDPDDPERRVLASVKSNLGPAPESLAYRLVDAGSLGVARVQWEGRTSHTAHTLLAEPSGDINDAAIDRWLTEFLAAGRQKATDVYAAADASGYSKDKAKRAKKAIGAEAVRDGAAGAWFWELPGRTPQQGSEPAPDAPVTPPLLPCSLAGHDGQTDPPNTQGSKGARGRETAPPSGATSPESLPASQNLGATGATGGDLHKQIGATGPETQSRQLFETGATVPGAPTERTPGLTPKVRASLEAARSSFRPPAGEGRCPSCGCHLSTQGHADTCDEREAS